MSAVRSPEPAPTAPRPDTGGGVAAGGRTWSIMAADKIVASGLAMPFPAMSGRCRGWARRGPCCSCRAGRGGSADGAGQHRGFVRGMSPNILPVTTTSSFLGALTSCMAALSTTTCDRAPPGVLGVDLGHHVLPGCEVSPAHWPCPHWSASCHASWRPGRRRGRCARSRDASSAWCQGFLCSGKWPSTAVRRPRAGRSRCHQSVRE